MESAMIEVVNFADAMKRKYEQSRGELQEALRLALVEAIAGICYGSSGNDFDPEDILPLAAAEISDIGVDDVYWALGDLDAR
jgi:hypothetical protein